MKRMILVLLSVLLSVTYVIAQQEKGTFTDERDGQAYKWVKIGEQVWMAENLNYKLNSKCVCYDRNESNCEVYGRLYTWKIACKACPNGYHIPSKDEWHQLVQTLGGEKVAVEKLKSKEFWPKEAKGTDIIGFSMLPSGLRWANGEFEYMNEVGFYWCLDSGDLYGNESIIKFEENSFGIWNSGIVKNLGAACRCLKD